MKYSAIIMIMLAFNIAIGQSPTETSKALSNGEKRIEGTDPFGAQVVVHYNKDLVKVYQERTLNGETTFARFDNGQVVEYGTVYKPALVKLDEE